jgi:hypothetical protein
MGKEKGRMPSRKPIPDLKTLIVLIIRLLRRDLSRLVNRIELVEPWDKR